MDNEQRNCIFTNLRASTTYTVGDSRNFARKIPVSKEWLDFKSGEPLTTTEWVLCKNFYRLEIAKAEVHEREKKISELQKIVLGPIEEKKKKLKEKQITASYEENRITKDFSHITSSILDAKKPLF